MEYTEYCPNCDYKLTVEENVANYVIKNNKGDAVTHCPNCHKELEVVDGVMKVVKK